VTDPLGSALRVRWLVIIPPAAIYFFSYFHRIAPAVVAEDLMRAFAIPAATLGNLAAIYPYVFAIMALPAGSLVSTPRHFTQIVVTEFGVADLYGVSDEKRGEKLIAIAHPDFRDSLKEEYEKIRRVFYKN